VPLARPRARASSAFAALEEHVLQRVLKIAPDDSAPLAHPFGDERFVRPSDVRWAV
jgi:sulfonate transport system ATP-binding protein